MDKSDLTGSYKTEADFYNTLGSAGEATFTDRGSKFIGHAYPVSSTEEVKQRLNEIKKIHAKASHHCFAYRLGTDNNTFRASDAGEPSGTAGKPILGQIDSKSLTDTLVIVVRYFGGSLLGVPGLINAYKTTAALALQVTPIVQKQRMVEILLHFNYTQLNEVLRFCKQAGVEIKKQDVQLFCDLVIAVPKSRLRQLEHQLNILVGVEVKKIQVCNSSKQ
jgi:uncharacterized YigZ family protein